MRCQRCSFVFVAPMWEQPEPTPAGTMKKSEEIEAVTTAGI
jgi:hypothetical protein